MDGRPLPRRVPVQIIWLHNIQYTAPKSICIFSGRNYIANRKGGISMKSLIYSVFLLLLAGCSPSVKTQIPAVTGFDVQRYLGRWYEVARLPNTFERGMTDVSAEYTLRPDGKIQVLNSGMKNGKLKKISGIARFAGASDRGELEVSFFRPFYGAYRIIRLTPDYSVACVMGSDTHLAWILARKPFLPEKEMKNAVDFLRTHGFAVENLIYPQQQNP